MHPVARCIKCTDIKTRQSAKTAHSANTCERITMAPVKSLDTLTHRKVYSLTFYNKDIKTLKGQMNYTLAKEF